MTEEELIQKFSDIFQNTFWNSNIVGYHRINHSTLYIVLFSGERLTFTYYDEKKWTLTCV